MAYDPAPITAHCHGLNGLPRNLWTFVEIGHLDLTNGPHSLTLATGSLLYKSPDHELAHCIRVRDWHLVAEQWTDRRTGRVHRWHFCGFQEDPTNPKLFTHYDFGEIANNDGSYPLEVGQTEFIKIVIDNLEKFYPQEMTSCAGPVTFKVVDEPKSVVVPRLQEAAIFHLAPARITTFEYPVKFVPVSVMTIEGNNHSQKIILGTASSTSEQRQFGPTLTINGYLFALNHRIDDPPTVYFISAFHDGHCYDYDRQDFPDPIEREKKLVQIIIRMFGRILFPLVY